jgi:hypothetical protein
LGSGQTGHGKRGKTGIASTTLFPEKRPLATKKGKMIEKIFLVVSPLLLYKINKNSELLKGK